MTQMNEKHNCIPSARAIRLLCVSVVCLIVLAGLWPFRAPRNDVYWLENENGLRFGRHGTVVSVGAFQENASTNDTSCSIELWLEPGPTDRGSTILAFDSSADPAWPFSLRKVGDDLIIQRYAPEEDGTARRLWFRIKDVFRKRARVFLTITSGRKDTEIYVDGALTEASAAIGLSRRDLTGRLVVANSTVNDSWSGQIFGLAIYHSQLTTAQIGQHYDGWAKNQRHLTTRDDAPIAVYLFNERVGNLVHNHVNGEHELTIPPNYKVVHSMFLSPPQRGHIVTWSYWKDFGVNLAGFIPFGLTFACYFSSVRRFGRPGMTTLTLGILLSLLIETLQTLLPTRDSDTTDIISNTLGTAIGVLAYRCSAMQILFARAACYVFSLPGISFRQRGRDAFSSQRLEPRRPPHEIS